MKNRHLPAIAAALLSVLACALYWTSGPGPGEDRVVEGGPEVIHDAAGPGTDVEGLDALASNESRHSVAQPEATEAARAEPAPASYGTLSEHMDRLEQGFLHFYEDLDAQQVRRVAVNLIRIFLTYVTESAHGAVLDAGQGTEIGKAKTLDNGRRTFTTPPGVTRNQRFGMDRVASQVSGEVIHTRIALDAVPGFADRLAEINWLLDRYKRMR